VQWACENCGYIHDDGDKPISCPVCGAPGSRFSEYFEDDLPDDGPAEEEIDDDFDKDLFADYEDD